LAKNTVHSIEARHEPLAGKELTTLPSSGLGRKELNKFTNVVGGISNTEVEASVESCLALRLLGGGEARGDYLLWLGANQTVD
jgi:hypothetical protein